MNLEGWESLIYAKSLIKLTFTFVQLTCFTSQSSNLEINLSHDENSVNVALVKKMIMIFLILMSKLMMISKIYTIFNLNPRP